MIKCEQCKWEKVNEQPVASFGWRGNYEGSFGKDVLYQCKVCGRLQKIHLGN